MTDAAGFHDRRGLLLGFAFAAAAVLYAFAVHQGIGPVPAREHLAWYEPRGFLARWSWLAWAFETTPRLMLVLLLPPLLLTAAVFVSGGSALARALALSAVIATALFCFYGDVAVRIWEFFRWRGSAVLALTAVVVGFALAAPFLATSWLRLSWPLRLAVYLPVCFAVLALMRNATGTDPSLPFSISPWPAVPVFGIEVGAFFVMIWLMGAAIGTGGLALTRGRGVAAAAAAVALGVGVPLALIALGSALSLLPFKAGPATLGVVAVACALAIALSSTLGVRGQPEALRERALHLAVGTLLIAVPMFTGQVWARWDYYWTREHDAREIIDALQHYYEKEDIYPDDLDGLVKHGFLTAIPKPSIGFGFLYDGAFRYRSFGTSFLLEFPAPRWVECAYTPPYDEDEGEDDAADATTPGDDEGGLGEAWSCPSKPPELW